MPTQIEPAISIEHLMAQLSLRVRLFREARNPMELPEGISEREMAFLEYLEIVHGESDTSAMNKFFQKVSPSTISANIEKLFSKNLVTRNESPKDRRIKVVKITSKGLKCLEGVREERNEKMFKHIAVALMIEEHEIPILSRLIRNAIKNLNAVLGLAEEGDKNQQPLGAPMGTG